LNTLGGAFFLRVRYCGVSGLYRHQTFNLPPGRVYAAKLLQPMFHEHQMGGQLPTVFIFRISSLVRSASARSWGLNAPLKLLRLVVAYLGL
jgi:hypothetical protein